MEDNPLVTLAEQAAMAEWNDMQAAAALADILHAGIDSTDVEAAIETITVLAVEHTVARWVEQLVVWIIEKMTAGKRAEFLQFQLHFQLANAWLLRGQQG